MENFYKEKAYFMPGKNQENLLSPSEKYFSYAPESATYDIQVTFYILIAT